MKLAAIEAKVGAAFADQRGERLARWLLALAVLAAAALLLWLNRGTSFYNDELTWFRISPGPTTSSRSSPRTTRT